MKKKLKKTKGQKGQKGQKGRKEAKLGRTAEQLIERSKVDRRRLNLGLRESRKKNPRSEPLLTWTTTELEFQRKPKPKSNASVTDIQAPVDAPVDAAVDATVTAVNPPTGKVLTFGPGGSSFSFVAEDELPQTIHLELPKKPQTDDRLKKRSKRKGSFSAPVDAPVGQSSDCEKQAKLSGSAKRLKNKEKDNKTATHGGKKRRKLVVDECKSSTKNSVVVENGKELIAFGDVVQQPPRDLHQRFAAKIRQKSGNCASGRLGEDEALRASKSYLPPSIVAKLQNTKNSSKEVKRQPLKVASICRDSSRHSAVSHPKRKIRSDPNAPLPSVPGKGSWLGRDGSPI